MWTAPEVTDRPEPPHAVGEREMLEGWLEWHRKTLLHKCAGLTADQLVIRSTEPSSLTLLGLVRHMADVERIWFRIRFAGEAVGREYSSPENRDGEFDDVDPANAERDFAQFRDEVEIARRVADGRSLDETFLHPRTKETLNLRWIYVHMIEEYARHNGHADLIRERIDGVTGE